MQLLYANVFVYRNKATVLIEPRDLLFVFKNHLDLHFIIISHESKMLEFCISIKEKLFQE
jgi:hypothetical protein